MAAGQAVTARGEKVRPKRYSDRKGASLRNANQPGHQKSQESVAFRQWRMPTDSCTES